MDLRSWAADVGATLGGTLIGVLAGLDEGTVIALAVSTALLIRALAWLASASARYIEVRVRQLDRELDELDERDRRDR